MKAAAATASVSLGVEVGAGDLEKKAPVEVGREKNEAGLAQDPYCPEVTAFSSCELRLPSYIETIPKPALQSYPRNAMGNPLPRLPVPWAVHTEHHSGVWGLVQPELGPVLAAPCDDRLPQTAGPCCKNTGNCSCPAPASFHRNYLFKYSHPNLGSDNKHSMHLQRLCMQYIIQYTRNISSGTFR